MGKRVFVRCNSLAVNVCGKCASWAQTENVQQVGVAAASQEAINYWLISMVGGGNKTEDSW